MNMLYEDLYHCCPIKKEEYNEEFELKRAAPEPSIPPEEHNCSERSQLIRNNRAWATLKPVTRTEDLSKVTLNQTQVEAIVLQLELDREEKEYANEQREQATPLSYSYTNRPKIY